MQPREVMTLTANRIARRYKAARAIVSTLLFSNGFYSRCLQDTAAEIAAALINNAESNIKDQQSGNICN